MREIEADGFITYGIDEVSLPKTPEKKTNGTAKPVSSCAYPRCEECGHYISHESGMHCDVPMVVDKQNWHLLADLLLNLSNRLTEVEKLVTDEILGEK